MNEKESITDALEYIGNLLVVIIIAIVVIGSFIPHDKTILDTFCGIGTTNLACQNLGRASIGIDINANYIKIAKKRYKVDIPSLQDFFGDGNEG